MALTAKQEQFARGIALKGLDQSAAYSAAYDCSKSTAKTIGDAAYKLRKNPEIEARILVLTERATAAAVKSAVYTLEDAIRETEQARQNGAALGQTSAEVAAIKLKAQLGGHLVEKKEIRNGPLTETDADKLYAMRQALEDQLKRAQEARDLVGGAAPEAAQPARRVIG